MFSETLLCDEGVVNGRHGEIGDASTSVTEAGGDGVGGANDVLVEEASGPYLARYETAAQDTDEEPEGVELVYIVCCA